jgi:hypothetical protein
VAEEKIVLKHSEDSEDEEPVEEVLPAV